MMTLSQWCVINGVDGPPASPSGVVLLHADEGCPGYWGLWHLEDYRVAGFADGVVRLEPVAKE